MGHASGFPTGVPGSDFGVILMETARTDIGPEPDNIYLFNKSVFRRS